MTSPPQRTATLCSLIASAERHDLDPHAYLRGVLARILHAGDTVGEAAAGLIKLRSPS